MKMKQNLFVLPVLGLLLMLCQGCSEDKEENPPAPESPSITVESEEDIPVFDTAGGTLALTFTTTSDWTASVDGAASGWLSVSPASGEAGTHTLSLVTTANDSYDERNASVTITSGSVKKTITVTQKQKDALLLTSNKVELEAEGGDFSIELQANVEVTYEIESGAQTWLTPVARSRGLTSSVLAFHAEANEEAEARQAVIKLAGGNGLTEEVTVYQMGTGPTLLLSQSEYIVSSAGETIQVELRSNTAYEIEMPGVDWLRENSSRSLSTYTHYFIVDPNETYDARSAVIRFVDEENELKDSVNIVQVQKDAIILAKNKYEVSGAGETLNFSIQTNVDFTVSTNVDWITQNNTRGLTEYPLSFTISPNDNDNSRTGIITIADANNNRQEITVEQTGKVNLKDIEREALIELYKTTGGDNWGDNTNWCSDKPVSEWLGISVTENGEVRGIVLLGNGLTGTLPESFSIFLDHCEWIMLNGNNMHGTIPSSITMHPRWSEFAWDIIIQCKPYYGDSKPINFDFTGINLKITDANLTLLDGSRLNSLEWCRRNDINVVLTAEKRKTMIPDITELLINLQLDYQNKGLGTLLCFTDCNTPNELKEYEWEDIIDNTVTTNLDYVIGTDNYFLHTDNSYLQSRMAYIFDKEGNLVNLVNYDNYIPPADSEAFFGEVKRIISTYLGEPEEHPEYVPGMYTSTDYSKDGEVTVLQKATVGKGIDLVLMGDAFVDKDMEEGGPYESTMKVAMEELFSVEPYKSLKERFNVYMVKAVSPNGEYTDGAKRAIEGDDDCFEYALKVPGINTERLNIIMSANPKKLATTSYASLYEDGSFVAYILSSTIGFYDVLHEAGGHGIAKLADEYIIEGSDTMPEENKEIYDYAWTTKGWWANVDWRSDPETVKWARFLKDERYKDENLGVFEGADTWEYGCYRPSEYSTMNGGGESTSYLNAPSREQIYKTVMQLSEGSSWTYDYEEFVRFDAVSRNAAASRSLRQQPSATQVEKWKKTHRPPVRVKGTWRDAKKNHIVVPYR